MNPNIREFMVAMVQTESSAISACDRNVPDFAQSQNDAREVMFSMLSSFSVGQVVTRLVEEKNFKQGIVPPFARTVLDLRTARSLAAMQSDDIEAVLRASTAYMDPATVLRGLRSDECHIILTQLSSDLYLRMLKEQQGPLPAACLERVVVWEVNVFFNAASMFDADRVFNAQIMCASHEEGLPPSYEESPEEFLRYVKRYAPHFYDKIVLNAPSAYYREQLLTELSAKITGETDLSIVRSVLFRVDFITRNASHRDQISMERFLGEWTTNIAQKMQSCGNCGKCRVALSVCSRCRKQRYCNASCQHEHWKVHRTKCHRRHPGPNEKKKK